VVWALPALCSLVGTAVSRRVGTAVFRLVGPHRQASKVLFFLLILCRGPRVGCLIRKAADGTRDTRNAQQHPKRHSS